MSLIGNGLVKEPNYLLNSVIIAEKGENRMQQNNASKPLLRRLSIRLMIFILFVVVIIYGLPLFIQLFYPFILAFIVAAAVNPLVNKVNSKLSKSKTPVKKTSTFAAFGIVSLLLTFISLFTYILFSVLIREMISLALTIQVNWPSIVLAFENVQSWIADQVGVLPEQTAELLNRFTENILSFIQNLSGSLLNLTVVATSLFISRTGIFFLNLVTFFLSLYFMVSDYPRIKKFIKKRLDHRSLKVLTLLKRSAFSGVGGYVKTQFILAFMAFMCMLIAFVIVGQEYALILALVLALIDLIPLIGTIAVLLPWGLIEWAIGDSKKGTFLLILGIAFFLFRRVIEPKNYGNSNGSASSFSFDGYLCRA